MSGVSDLRSDGWGAMVHMQTLAVLATVGTPNDGGQGMTVSNGLTRAEDDTATDLLARVTGTVLRLRGYEADGLRAPETVSVTSADLLGLWELLWRVHMLRVAGRRELDRVTRILTNVDKQARGKAS